MAVTTGVPTRRKRLIVCCDGTWQSSVALKRNVPSNVTRLARSFVRTDDTDPNDVWDQIVYYDAGIGTGEITMSEAIRQGSLGSGFSGNVIEAYNFLVLNYKPGDKIYCFGFSRGAYTARAVAGLVNDIGIISPRDMQDFPDLYYQYNWPGEGFKTSKPDWFRKSSYYRDWQCGVPARSAKGGACTIDGTSLKLWDKFPHEPAPEASRQVEVVGVFDTVGSLGVPDSKSHSFNLIKSGIRMVTNGGTSPGFHNVSLSPYTRHAFHALALDEHRGPFSPTLWHLPKRETKAKRSAEERQRAYEEADEVFWAKFKETSKYSKDEVKTHAKEFQALDAAWIKKMECNMDRDHGGTSVNYLEESELEQVWFPGYHCNIGGGDPEALDERKGDLEQIALISFAWMCDKLRPYLRFEDKLRKRTVGDRMALINPIIAEIEEGRNRDFGNWLVKPLWKAADAFVPGYNCPQKLVSDYTRSGWATGPIVDSFTLEYALAQNIPRTPGRYRYAKGKNDEIIDLGKTNEKIHPCVAFRKAMLQGDRLGKNEKAYDPDALKLFKRTPDGEGWMWEAKDTSIEPIPELRIDGDLKCKFSYFMAKNHLKYLDEVIIQKTRTDKGPKAPEKDLAASAEVCNTLAIKFLTATNKGKEWTGPYV